MTKLVGILNVTPDSFSDGNMFYTSSKALAQAKKLFNEGASLVDLGGESTRPGAEPIGAIEEWERIGTVLKDLLRLYPGKISVDTYQPETANKALALGDVAINDVTGMNNPAMIEVVVSHHARCIVSHLPADNVQNAHTGLLIDDVEVVKSDLLAKVIQLEASGLPRDNIVLDPGIGFGKTFRLNWDLLKFAEKLPGYKVMIGYSRKRFLGGYRLEIEPNLEAGKIAIASGAYYLRVHDVASHRNILKSYII
jgi:dihydropteroate synthase